MDSMVLGHTSNEPLEFAADGGGRTNAAVMADGLIGVQTTSALLLKGFRRREWVVVVASPDA